MTEITRYDLTWEPCKDDARMMRWLDGDYVRYDDVLPYIKDALRYRWLMLHSRHQLEKEGVGISWYSPTEDLSEQIDKAMEKDK